MNNENQVAVIIIGPSGSGKSTLERKLKELAPNEFHKVISTTTRDIRPEDGEEDGVTYDYVSVDKFKQIPMVEEVNFGGNYYGIPKAQFDTDKDLLLVVEPHGAEQVIDYLECATLIVFMNPPHDSTVENMRKRGDSEEKIQKRLEIDDIEKRFNESGLNADKVVKKLTPNLHLDVYEYIQIFKKNIS